MPETITVTLQSTESPSGYVTPHVLNLSSANDAGKTITFEATGSGFGVTIPNASTLFNTSEGTLAYGIGAGKSQETPAIRSELSPESEWEYYVYCEETKDWADKPDASPPRIIIQN